MKGGDANGALSRSTSKTRSCCLLKKLYVIEEEDDKILHIPYPRRQATHTAHPNTKSREEIPGRGKR